MASVLEGIPALLPVGAGQSFTSAYGQANDQRMKSDTIDFQKAKEVSTIVSHAALAADTPEKWGQMITTFQKHFPTADLSGFGFDSRDALLAQMRDPYKDASLALEKSNAARAQANADRTYNLAAAAAGVPSGYRKTADGNLEQIPGGPAAVAAALDQQKLTQGGNDNVGLTPIPGVDANGNPTYALPSRTGKAVPLTFPDGFSISKEPIKVDTPTETILLDPITRQPIGRIPKDVAGAAKATAIGTAQGGAQAQLPTAITDAERTIGQIDDLAKAPGLGGITGGPFNMAVNQFKPDWQMSPEERDALTRLQQLQGTGFLQARQLLKGGGAITDFEGQKAEQAMSRMNRALSKEDFVKALNDFKDAVQSGVAKLKATAGVGAGATPAAPTAPTVTAPAPAVDGGNWLDLGNGIRIRPVN